jgi:hypothetical protein
MVRRMFRLRWIFFWLAAVATVGIATAAPASTSKCERCPADKGACILADLVPAARRP